MKNSSRCKVMTPTLARWPSGRPRATPISTSVAYLVSLGAVVAAAVRPARETQEKVLF